MTAFSALALAEPLVRAVSERGYRQTTPIQAAAIPALLEGRDVLGIAQTGTGKTASFVLPSLDAIARDPQPCKSGTCRALILAPTRELAAQIADQARLYGKFMRLRVALVVGGVRPEGQIRALSRGVDLLVATPGRLLDHLDAGVVRLDRVQSFVLDEADQMLDLGFLAPIRRIVARLPEKRRAALFSATMPPSIRALADEFMNDPREIATASVARPIERIRQSVRHVARGDKRALLTTLLRAPEVGRAIVFTRTKRGADRVEKDLGQDGLDAVAIHGAKSQAQRSRALAAFRKGSARILVATDIAARGIDVEGVDHVINLDIPEVPEAYVHRIGRTARAGRDGAAISLCAPDERAWLAAITKLTGAPIAVVGEEPKGPIERPKGRGGVARPARGHPRSARPAASKQGGARLGEPNQDGRQAARRGAASAQSRSERSEAQASRSPSRKARASDQGRSGSGRARR